MIVNACKSLQIHFEPNNTARPLVYMREPKEKYNIVSRRDGRIKRVHGVYSPPNLYVVYIGATKVRSNDEVQVTAKTEKCIC